MTRQRSAYTLRLLERRAQKRVKRRRALLRAAEVLGRPQARLDYWQNLIREAEQTAERLWRLNRGILT